MFEGRPLTTKGRWLNPFVFLNFKLSQIISKRKTTKPIYIVGTGRSGTTIFGLLLSVHREVGFLNEPKAIWSYINKNEDIIGNYNLNDAFYELNEYHASKEQSLKLNKIYSYFLSISSSKRIVDKYPELIFRVPYVLSLFPDSKFIFLIRNGYDTCTSIDLWSKRLGKNNKDVIHDWWGRDNRKWKLLIDQIIMKDAYYKKLWSFVHDINNHLEMAAIEWIATMRVGLKMIELYPKNIMKLYYEKLVENPSENLKRVETYCELKHDETFIEYGCEVLKPNKPKESIKLRPEIKLLFDDTMQNLNY